MDLTKIIKKKKPAEYILYTAAILLGILLDIVTKAIATANLYPNKSFTVINGVLSFTYHKNPGAAWGMLKDAPWVFNTVSLIAIIAMLAYLYLGHANTKMRAISIAVIVSGGIGNMIERLSQGYVVDFIHATFIDFPIFNVADCCVTVGAAFLILSLVLEIIDEAREKKAAGESSEEADERPEEQTEKKETEE